MKLFIVLTLLILLSLSLSVIETPLYADTKADTIFKNGNIYTVNDRQPHAEAIAVKNGKIIYVGSNRLVKRFQTSTTRVVDLQGNTVVPGFTDSHYHLIGVGEREVSLNLEGTSSLEDMLAKLKQRVESAKPGEWIVGRGWIETFWKPPVFPTAQDLDRVSPNNPVFLDRADGHGAVVNSLALKIAKIDKNSPNPQGGEILKEKSTGEPTGMLLDKAQDIVTRNIPAPTDEDIERAILLGVERSLKLGWCQIQDAGGSYKDVALMRKLYNQGKIKLRIYKAVHGPGQDAEKLLKEGMSVGEYDGRFTLRTIKLVYDGALGSRGAALLEPYSDHDTSGFLINKPETLYPILLQALRTGIQVETHAIGDRANREVLALYERAFKEVLPKDRKIATPRWRVEHAQILKLNDLNRFARLGIIPSMQPSHAISDLHFAPRRLGIERLAGAYAWQSLLKSGALIAAGSDAPVERGEPLIEFYAAVARKDQQGFSGDGWHLEEAVTRQQALRMFTLWAAYAAFEEKTKGSIEVGKIADLTVFSKDIMMIAEKEILQTKCVMTVVGGDVVFELK